MADYQQIKNVADGEAEDGEENAEAEEKKNEQKQLFGYPVQVFFILGNEFCERFSYYGMHAILVIYLMRSLNMTEDKATVVYHAFNMLCYFSPIIGAIIADSYWGKYKTIFYFSLVYALGNIIVSITAIPSVLNAVQLYGPMLGLILIGLGTGGIKPCVSSFGGDQFDPGQEDKLQTFFSIFYFAINFGSLISMLLTPVLRADVKCFGYDCYPLGFGVPAILMILSLVIFLAGSRLYKRVPPEGNILVQVSSVVGNAIKNKLRNCGSGGKNDHWIDWASDEYSSPLKSDIKALFKVLLMFLPLPVFWTLFDQQGSRWVLQAINMNGDIGWFGTVKPDQMQALNAVFVMLLIPLTQKIIYPLASICGVLTKPLQKMGTGMVLVALSFFMAGFLQIHMESMSSITKKPPSGFAEYRIINTLPCDISAFSQNFTNQNVTITHQHATDYFAVPSKLNRVSFRSECPSKMRLEQDVRVNASNSYSLVVGTNQGKLFAKQYLDEITAPGHGRSKVRFIYTRVLSRDYVTIKLDSNLQVNLTSSSNPEYIDVISKTYYMKAVSRGSYDVVAYKKITIDQGGIYTIVIQPNTTSDGLQFLAYEDVSPRTVSILWQIPQYLVITLGEVMFSITGLEFAYSQSPQSMKSCIMAAWLLTVSVGNLLVVILTDLKLSDDLAKEFFFFSGLLGVVTVIFIIMAYFYKYVNYGCCSAVEDRDVLDEAEQAPLLSEQGLSAFDQGYKSTGE